MVTVPVAALGLTYDKTFSKLALTVLAVLSIGLFEEYLFRGVILGRLLTIFRATNHGVLKALGLTSLLFCGAHLINLTNQPLSATLLQMAVTFAMGLFFGSLYYKTGSLFWPWGLHALTDFVGLSRPTLTVSATSVNIPAILIQVIIWGLLAWFVLRRKTHATL